MVYQHPQLKFVVCPQAMHYDPLQNLCTIVSMFFLSQYLAINPDQSVITIRLELCGIRPWHRLTTHWHLFFSISHRGSNIFVIATSVLTSKQHPHFSPNDFSLNIRITFQHSISEQIHNSFIHIAIRLPLFSLL